MLSLDPQALHRHRVDMHTAYYRHLFPVPLPKNCKAVIVNGRRYPSALDAQDDTGIPAKTIKEHCNGSGPPTYHVKDLVAGKLVIKKFNARFA